MWFPQFIINESLFSLIIAAEKKISQFKSMEYDKKVLYKLSETNRHALHTK